MGYVAAARCKIAAAIYTVTPLATTTPKTVSAGSTISINGTDFQSQCNGCQVTATPAGSTTAQPLTVATWTNETITAALPASLTGLLTISVKAVTGLDAINIMAVPATASSTIAVTPSSLQFTYTGGGTVPAASPIQITNSGSGTLAWTATTTASWLSLSAASGTAPSTLNLAVSPGSLTAGTYTSDIQLAATGASNTPVKIAVTLTVSAAVTPAALSVAPKTLTFNYAVGATAPAAQSVSITNIGAGTLSWTASSSALWIGLSAASGTAPATLKITVNPANMAAGTLYGNRTSYRSRGDR